MKPGAQAPRRRCRDCIIMQTGGTPGFHATGSFCSSTSGRRYCDSPREELPSSGHAYGGHSAHYNVCPNRAVMGAVHFYMSSLADWSNTLYACHPMEGKAEDGGQGVCGPSRRVIGAHLSLVAVLRVAHRDKGVLPLILPRPERAACASLLMRGADCGVRGCPCRLVPLIERRVMGVAGLAGLLRGGE
jgi:hypothetical protein